MTRSDPNQPHDDAMAPPASPAGPEDTARTRRDRGREFVATVRDRADGTLAEIESRRSTSPLIDAGYRLTEHNRAVGGVVLAGAVAFRIFIFAVPFVFVFFVSLGIYGDASSPSDAAARSGMSGLAAKTVTDAAGASQGAQVTALVVGTFAMLWAAFGLARVLRISNALAWRCDLRRLARPWAAPLVVVAFTLGILTLLRLLKAARDGFGPAGTLLTLAAVLAFAAMWLAVSMVLPRRDDTNWFDLVPGSLLVGLGVQAIHLVTVYWFTARVSSLSDRYGALGAALGILSWAYLVGWLAIGSAVLNAVVHDAFGRHRRRWFPAGPAPATDADVGGG